MPELVVEILAPHARAGIRSLARFPVRIGRNPEFELAFDPERDRATSWDHARITATDAGFVLTDQKSTNGTFVNGQRVTTVILKHGDRVELGQGGPQLRVTLPDTPLPGEITAKTMVATADLPTIHLKLVEGGRGRRPLEKDYHQQVITLGRDAQNDISFAEPPHPVVSRYHAEIVLRGGEYQIVDKGATNGTLVNGHKVQCVTLRNGDRIMLGEGGPVLSVSLAATGARPRLRARKLWPVAAAAALLGAGAVWFWPGSPDQSATPSDEALSESQFIERSVMLFASRMKNEIESVPPSLTRNIQRYTTSLARTHRDVFLDKLRRAQTLMPVVQRILRENNLPEQLAYIAFQESRFDPSARSGAGAVGLWQFMPATGREYGLRVDEQADERLDPEKSTHAACRYLKSLWLVYGDFMLVLAAYNYGPGNVNRALRKIMEDDPLRNRNYWYLVKKDLLPKETDEYVYKIISGWIVASHPERYGFPPELATEKAD